MANKDLPLVANREFVTNKEFQPEQRASGRLRGWRVERNANGYYRYRWQIKKADGSPETYTTSAGGVGYRRGSRYLPQARALRELRDDKKKRR